MKRLVIGCCFTLVYLNILSQKTLNVDKDIATKDAAVNYMYTVAGVPFMKAKFARVVEGSPFFNEQMMRAAIILSEGKEYKYLKVRLNLLETQVNYLNENQEELIASSPIKEVILWDTIQEKDYRFVFSDHIVASVKPEKDFYELLQTGKAELYKQYKKTMRESKPYGSATIEQSIQTRNYYYVLLNQQWTRIKKVKDFGDVFADKKEEVLKFIGDHKLSDNETGFESITAYYNNVLVQK